jgi:polyhydroxyalkanoate synthesis regulator phasin
MKLLKVIIPVVVALALVGCADGSDDESLREYLEVLIGEYESQAAHQQEIIDSLTADIGPADPTDAEIAESLDMHDMILLQQAAIMEQADEIHRLEERIAELEEAQGG